MGTEDAVCCPMGFGTNAMNLPALASENTLVLSDEFNHASLILGLRSSKAKIIIFKHNGKITVVRISRAYLDINIENFKYFYICYEIPYCILI